MTQSAVDDRLSQARSAVQRLAWTEAHELLTELDAAGGLDPDDLANLARACHWTGRMDDCLDTYARSYALYLAGGNTRGAAFVALELVRWHRHKLAGAVAAGWLRRAERLLEDDGDSREYGYLQLRHAHGALAAGDLERAAELAQIAHEYGRRHGDRDLELLGLHDYGLALVELGQVEEGFAHVDEAAAAAVGGETGPLATAIVYCNTIGACRDVADYRRASDWTEATKRWCDEQTINGFPGMCRVYRAEVMRLRGDWATAQDDGQLACAELREWSPAVAGAAFYELGEIRLRTGDVDGAEAAAAELREVADRYDSTALSAAAASAAGAVALARGDTATAVGSFRAALQAWRLADVPYEGARTRVLLAQAYLRGGDRAAATLELDSAKAVFVRLGAAPDVRRIAELESDGGGQEAHRCFLFTDIVDSTTLAGALGDEAWTGLLG